MHGLTARHENDTVLAVHDACCAEVQELLGDVAPHGGGGGAHLG